MLSRNHLALVFAAAFVLLFVVLMPARLAVSWLGLDTRLSYSDVQGTLFHAELSGATYRGMPLGNVTVEPSLGALFTGSLSGDVQVRGQGISGSAVVRETDADIYSFTNLKLVTPVAAGADGWPLRGSLSLTASELVLGPQGCMGGSFTLRTDAFSSALSQLGAGELVLVGDGACLYGQPTMALAGENEQLSLTLNAKGMTPGTLVAEVTLIPKAALAGRDDLQMALNFAGLRRNGNAWAGEIHLPLGF
ncbi:type II secretion system protein N [Kordiimonas gwangyangensis]|uniref:type II secretion system protein N n=1 Tax=Kordiimonas gwangyangensis TaxID=288022 RepID=UPI00035E4A0B|nr:type II secretion system protein N [Kordiimonas gwangyangensis]